MAKKTKSALVAMDDNETYLAIRVDGIWYGLPDSASSSTRLLYGSVIVPAGHTTSPDVKPK